MSVTIPSVPSTGFLRLPQILALFPISKSAWWEGCKEGRFPKPVKLGPRTTVWRAEEIKAFIERVGRNGQEAQPAGEPHAASRP